MRAAWVTATKKGDSVVPSPFLFYIHSHSLNTCPPPSRSNPPATLNQAKPTKTDTPSINTPQ